MPSTRKSPRAALERALALTLRRLPGRVLLALSGRPQDRLDGQPLDPEAQILCVLAEKLRRPWNELTPAEARRDYRASMDAIEAPARPSVMTEDRSIPGPAGQIPIRVYRPRSLATPAPVLVYFHGGGWVIGDLDTHDRLCRVLAEDGRCLVVAVDYRLAPEHRFPAAVDDAIAAHRWIAANAASLGGDPARVAVGGDSAGGTLSAVVTLAAKAGGPMPCFQLLFYPALDLTMSTPSHRTFETGYLLSGPIIAWFKEHYYPPGVDIDRDWRGSPLFAPDVSGLPPGLVLTAGYDPLRDEARAYADRLEQAGVTLRYRCFPGLVHGFASMSGAVAAARDAVGFAAATLSRELGGKLA